MKKLDHERMAKYVDSFEWESGAGRQLVLVQSFVDAPSIEQWLREKRLFSIQTFFAIAEQLFDILQYLQSFEPPVVHRDIKPSNLLFDAAGQLTLVDFGLVASPLKGGRGSTVAGTLGYMAPEQLMGNASPASDVYAAFATLLHILTGVDPAQMDAEGFQIHYEPYLQGLPEEFGAFFQSSLKPRPQERLSDLAQIQGDLARLMAQFSPEQLEKAQGDIAQAQWEKLQTERSRQVHKIEMREALQSAKKKAPQGGRKEGGIAYVDGVKPRPKGCMYSFIMMQGAALMLIFALMPMAVIPVGAYLIILAITISIIGIIWFKKL